MAIITLNRRPTSLRFKAIIIDTISFADDDGYGFATNKGNEELVELLNEFIQLNKENGKFDEMYITAQEGALKN